MSQKYMFDILSKIDLLGCRIVDMPMETKSGEGLDYPCIY